MEPKIQELAEQLYQAGVEKGNQRAQAIESEARAHEEDILSGAHRKASQILAAATREAEELRQGVASEIRLASQQAVTAVKQDLLNLLSAEVLDDSVGASLRDPEVIGDLIRSMVQNWHVGGAADLEILLPEDQRIKLEEAFQQGMKDVLDDGVTLAFSRDLKGGLRIGPVNGSIKVSLTDDDFREFFKEYLRPRARSFLFDE